MTQGAPGALCVGSVLFLMWEMLSLWYDVWPVAGDFARQRSCMWRETINFAG